MTNTRILGLLLCSSLGAQCPTFGTFSVNGNLPANLQPPRTCSEVSGLVVSRHNPGVLFVEDDSGNAPQIVALRANGSLAQQYHLDNVSNRDWEDLAIGPGPEPGRDYLYVADIGNNNLTYTTFWLLRVPEPDVPATPQATIGLQPEVFAFHYPGTLTHNAETLWIDPVDGTPYVMTKSPTSTCYVFAYPMPLDSRADKALQLVATLSSAPLLFTGGTITPDGRWIFARNASAILGWPRNPKASFASAFLSAPCSIANAQGQAEAIAVTPDGRGFYAISEGAGAPINYCTLAVPGGNPSWYAFGTGVPGTGGVPGLGALSAPVLGGAPITLGSWQMPGRATSLLVVAATAHDDGQIPVLGGFLHAWPALVLLPFTSGANGTVSLALGAVPDLPALRGAPVHAQSFTLDVSARQGVSMTAGLTLVLDR